MAALPEHLKLMDEIEKQFATEFDYERLVQSTLCRRARSHRPVH